MKKLIILLFVCIHLISGCSGGSKDSKRPENAPEETTTFSGTVSYILNNIFLPAAHAQANLGQIQQPKCYSKCSTSECISLYAYSYEQKNYNYLCSTDLIDDDKNPATPKKYEFNVSKNSSEGYAFKILFNGKEKVFEGKSSGLSNLEVDAKSTAESSFLKALSSDMGDAPKAGNMQRIKESNRSEETLEMIAKGLGYDPNTDEWKTFLEEQILRRLPTLILEHKNKLKEAIEKNDPLILYKDFINTVVNYRSDQKISHSILTTIFSKRDKDEDGYGDLNDCDPFNEEIFQMKELFVDKNYDGCADTRDKAVRYECSGEQSPRGFGFKSLATCESQYPTVTLNLYSVFKNDSYQAIPNEANAFYYGDKLSIPGDNSSSPLHAAEQGNNRTNILYFRYALESNGKIIRLLKDWNSSRSLEYRLQESDLRPDLYLVAAVKNADTYMPLNEWGDAIIKKRLYAVNNKCPTGSVVSYYDQSVGTDMCSWRQLEPKELLLESKFKQSLYLKFNNLQSIPHFGKALSTSLHFPIKFDAPLEIIQESSSSETSIEVSSSSESTSSDEAFSSSSETTDQSSSENDPNALLTTVRCSIYKDFGYITNLSNVFFAADYLFNIPSDPDDNPYPNSSLQISFKSLDKQIGIRISCEAPSPHITASWFKTLLERMGTGVTLYANGPKLTTAQKKEIADRKNRSLCTPSRYSGDVASHRYRYKRLGSLPGDACDSELQLSRYEDDCSTGPFSMNPEYDQENCNYPTGASCTSPEASHGAFKQTVRYTVEVAPKPYTCSNYVMRIKDRCIDGTWTRVSGTEDGTYEQCSNPTYSSCTYTYNARDYWGFYQPYTINLNHNQSREYSEGNFHYCGYDEFGSKYGWNRYKVTCNDGQVSIDSLGCY